MMSSRRKADTTARQDRRGVNQGDPVGTDLEHLAMRQHQRQLGTPENQHFRPLFTQMLCRQQQLLTAHASGKPRLDPPFAEIASITSAW